MLREIAIPTDENYVFHIPKEYINKQVEFIAFPIDDEDQEKSKAKPKKRTGYGILKGKIHMATDFDAPLDDFKEYM